VHRTQRERSVADLDFAAPVGLQRRKNAKREFGGTTANPSCTTERNVGMTISTR
jgi:hypothetical protein